MTIGAPIFYPAGPIDIRNGTASRVAAVPGLAAVYGPRTMPGQDAQLPYVIVWNAGEQTEPWGDANVGDPTFEHRLTLIVDVLAAAPAGSTPQTAETALDTSVVGFVETIRATLLTDPTWVNLFEGIERCSTRYAYPKEAQSIMAQATIEFEVTFKSEWPPVVPNDLLEVAVTATSLSGSPEVADILLPGTGS